ncbi:interactor of HORMAD1 protein 1 isoform X2 [Brienomyrus brachyistius]|uniref:interactor of HORMAD1 protein 1 isoform X2 n=1 Tax=Brienomyrus brachyistius TaxID=42636 RepID=UPI0020B251E9|nr:interactor of HORMAD1 protein 1 isoform X2 [Brienomyrus brachyistius]
MNPNTWNIKEILSIPPASGVPQKLSSVIPAASDYSSLTDSQFLFGSQFWPDQSQGLSVEMSFPSRTSQQNSEVFQCPVPWVFLASVHCFCLILQVNECRVSTSYQIKPYLFGGDSQDKTKVPTLTDSTNKGILEMFEADKRKAKERDESMLADRVLQLGNTMENMKLTLHSIDGSIESAKRVILEHLDSLTTTIQDHATMVQKSVVSPLESFLNELASLAQKLRDVEDRETKISVEVSALHSSVEILHRDLESLRAEHGKEQCMMGDILSQLCTLVSSHRLAEQVTDRAMQTSPCPFENVVTKKTKYQEGMRFWGPEPFALGDMEDPEKVSKAVEAEIPTECLANTLAVGASKEPLQKFYCTRSASAQRKNKHRSGSIPRCCKENAPPSEKKSPQGFSCKDEQAGVHKMGRGHIKANRPKRALRRSPRATPSETEMTWTLPTTQPVGLCQGAGEGGVQPKKGNAVQGHAGYSMATATWVTGKPHTLQTSPQNKGLWQLFSISDDSD